MSENVTEDEEVDRLEEGLNEGEQGGSNDAATSGDATMSDSTTRFEVQIDEETTLSRNDIVEHEEHGPMHVERVTVSAFGKTVQLQSELGPMGLELSDEDIREQWGETIHFDPAKLHDPNSMKVTSEGVSAEDQDIEVTITTKGSPEGDVEKVHMHALDEIIRAMRALRDGEMPDDVDGAPMAVDWEGVIDDV